MLSQKEISEKIAKVEALQGKTIGDVMQMPLFLEILTAYLTEQKETRKAAQQSFKAMAVQNPGLAMRFHLPAHCIDKFIDMTPEQFRDEITEVMEARSKRPAQERKYIKQLGDQAIDCTIAKICCEQFPELTEVYFPKRKLS